MKMYKHKNVVEKEVTDGLSAFLRRCTPQTTEPRVSKQVFICLSIKIWYDEVVIID